MIEPSPRLCQLVHGHWGVLVQGWGGLEAACEAAASPMAASLPPSDVAASALARYLRQVRVRVRVRVRKGRNCFLISFPNPRT